MDSITESKITKAKDILASAESVLVAFSGGVDSSLLLMLAREALGDKAAAATAVSPLLPESEKQAAKRFAEERAIPHFFVNAGEMDLPEFHSNPKDRCYVCKTTHMQALKTEAKKHGFARVAHGANLDDFSDYRPGLKAAKELSVLAPLADAGLGKQEVRDASKAMGLETWDKPSMACLASRIPYGNKITPEKLSAIEKAEDFLRKKGFAQFRVRHHGDTARIELIEKDFDHILNKSLRHGLVRHLEALGFSYVSLDLAGYKTGNLNKNL